MLKSLGKGSLVLVVEFRYCNMHGPCLFLKSLQSCKLNSVGSIGSYCDRVVYFVTLLLPCGTFLSPSHVGVMKVGEIYVYFWELSMVISYHFSDCIILT